jgi:hypothetical protein
MYCVILYYIVSYRIVPYHISYHIISYHIKSYHIIYHIILYYIIYNIIKYMFSYNLIGDLLFGTKIKLVAMYLSRKTTERKTCKEFLHCNFTRSSSTRVEQSNWGWQGSVVWTSHVISTASTKPTPSAEPNYHRHPVLQRRAR